MNITTNSINKISNFILNQVLPVEKDSFPMRINVKDKENIRKIVKSSMYYRLYYSNLLKSEYYPKINNKIKSFENASLSCNFILSSINIISYNFIDNHMLEDEIESQFSGLDSLFYIIKYLIRRVFLEKDVVYIDDLNKCLLNELFEGIKNEILESYIDFIINNYIHMITSPMLSVSSNLLLSIQSYTSNYIKSELLLLFNTRFTDFDMIINEILLSSSFLNRLIVKVSENLYDLIQIFPISKQISNDIGTIINSQIIDYKPMFDYSIFNQLTTEKVLTIESSTKEIIGFYLKTICFFRQINCQVSVEVTNLIVSYLKHRKDSFKCIADIIINKQKKEDAKERSEKECFFNEETDFYLDLDLNPLGKSFKNQEKQENYENYQDSSRTLSYFSDEEDSFFEFNPDFIEIHNKQRDILSILINIFGSDDDFLEEYKKMIIEKYLKTKDFDFVKQEVNLNLSRLKQRFPNSEVIFKIETVLKDLVDSFNYSRLGKYFIEKERILSVTIITKQFWSLKSLDYQTFLIGEGRINSDNHKDNRHTQHIITDHISTSTEKSNESTYINTVKSVELRLLNEINSFIKKYKSENKLKEVLFLKDFLTVTMKIQFQDGEYEFKVKYVTSLVLNLFEGKNIQHKPEEIVKIIRKMKKSFIKKEEKAYEDYEEEEIFRSIDFLLSNNVLLYDKAYGYYYVNTCVNKDKSKVITEEISVKFEDEKKILDYETLIIRILQNSGTRSIDEIYKSIIYIYKVSFSKNVLKNMLGKLIIDHRICREGEKYKILEQV